MSCGRQNDDDDEVPIQNGGIRKRPKQCLKCGNLGKIVVRLDTYCVDCFVFSFVGKFRRTMESARQGVKKRTTDMRLLVAFSGGIGSRALLDLFAQDDAEKSRFAPSYSALDVVHISQDPAQAQAVKSIVDQYNNSRINFICVPLDDERDKDELTCVDMKSEDFCFDIKHNQTPTSSSPPSFPSRKSTMPNTHQLDSYKIFKKLVSIAQNGGYDCLCTGESCTRLAVKTISNMALGRGYSLGEEVGRLASFYYDDSNEDGDLTSTTASSATTLSKAKKNKRLLLVCRPFSNNVIKEIAYYAFSLRKLDTVDSSFSTIPPATISIEKLANDFVYNLDAAYPPTTSIIARTTHKLNVRSDEKNVDYLPKCPICGLIADVTSKEWRNGNTMNSLSNGQGSSVQDDKEGMASLVCYGCLTALENERVAITKKNKGNDNVQIFLDPDIGRDAAEEQRRRRNRRTVGEQLQKEGLLLCDPSEVE